MKRVIGIDPGFICTGYAVIEGDGRTHRLIGSGAIELKGDFGERLGAVFKAVMSAIREYHPDDMSIETVFMHKSAVSALKLGHVRGAIISAGVVAGLPIHEYNTRFIKKTIVGKGNASKRQVQYMGARLLQVEERSGDDEADAVAIALCHTVSQLRSFKVMEEAL